MSKNIAIVCLAILLCGNYAMYAKAESVVEGQTTTGQVIIIKDSESDRAEQKEIRKAVRLLAAIGRDIRLGAKVGAYMGAASGGLLGSFYHPLFLIPGIVCGTVSGAVKGAVVVTPISLCLRLARFTSSIE